MLKISEVSLGVPVSLQATLYYPERVTWFHLPQLSLCVIDLETSLEGGQACILGVSLCPEPISLATVFVVPVVQSFYWLESLVTVIKESIRMAYSLLFILFYSILFYFMNRV